jgi:hypothetical protein
MHGNFTPNSRPIHAKFDLACFVACFFAAMAATFGSQLSHLWGRFAISKAISELKKIEIAIRRELGVFMHAIRRKLGFQLGDFGAHTRQWTSADASGEECPVVRASARCAPSLRETASVGSTGPAPPVSITVRPGAASPRGSLAWALTAATAPGTDGPPGPSRRDNGSREVTATASTQGPPGGPARKSPVLGEQWGRWVLFKCNGRSDRQLALLKSQ